MVIIVLSVQLKLVRTLVVFIVQYVNMVGTIIMGLLDAVPTSNMLTRELLVCHVL